MQLSEFRYDLPEESIAQRPIEPRDAARLLDTRDLSDHTFADLPDLLAPGDLLVVNSSRVRRARLRGTKVPTGGSIELVLLEKMAHGWSALVSPARRVRVGTRFDFAGVEAVVLDGPVDGIAVVDFSDESRLEEIGTVPLPPYIRQELEDPERYQTVYSDVPGSAAAPTAGLHFTPALLERLDKAGIQRVPVELHVGLGTFRPIATDNVDEHVMHSEWCAVPPETAAAIRIARSERRRVIAVGTTVVRTLETFARDDGTVDEGERRTELFLRPGSTFRVVDGLVTNFHVPGSSLLVMLAAFMGDGWRSAYETALERGYRFLSFGDAMYCERQ
jgi:S-adenosylmethionine:tRNA ribosyltransferase-isomerase